MKNVMIDIETLGLKTTAPVVSIGACWFEAGGSEFPSWSSQIDLDDSIRHGVPEGGTFRWWLERGWEAQRKTLFGRALLRDALIELACKIDRDTLVWANSPQFDIVILERCYWESGIPVPWVYKNLRDMRTIRGLGVVDDSEIPTVGDKHTAEDDAVWQARYTALALYRIEVACYQMGLR